MENTKDVDIQMSISQKAYNELLRLSLKNKLSMKSIIEDAIVRYCNSDSLTKQLYDKG